MLRNEAVISCRTIWSKISDIKPRLTGGKVVKQANVSLD